MTMTYAMLTGHLKWSYQCPICRRRFKGNGYYNHLRACRIKARDKPRMLGPPIATHRYG